MTDAHAPARSGESRMEDGRNSAKRLRGLRVWSDVSGDLALRVVAGPGDVHLFLPIWRHRPFNKPQGKFNYTWQGFTWENWLHPSAPGADRDALQMSLKWRRCRRSSPWCSARCRDRACAPTVPGAARPSTPSWCCH